MQELYFNILLQLFLIPNVGMRERERESLQRHEIASYLNVVQLTKNYIFGRIEIYILCVWLTHI